MVTSMSEAEEIAMLREAVKRLRNTALGAVGLLATIADAHAAVVMDNAQDVAAQDQLVAATRRGAALVVENINKWAALPME